MKLDHNLKFAITISVGAIIGISLAGLATAYLTIAETGILDLTFIYVFGIVGIVVGFITFILNISQIRSNNEVDKKNG